MSTVDLRNGADLLELARRRRLQGHIQNALRLEYKAELALGSLGSDVCDELLTAWAGSLAECPAELEEFQSAYSLEELRQRGIIDEEELKRRLDARHNRGPVRGGGL